jgi:hypothetical protein
MLQAMLRGKLTRPEEGMEDLLTSNTFGLMKYMSPEAALLPFLRQAQSPFHVPPLDSVLTGVQSVEKYLFWPTISYPDCFSCEPDVELIFRHTDGHRTGLLIEAKYRSGKSSLPCDTDVRPFDQLARELDNLRALAEDEGLSSIAVIYVTNNVVCPEEDLYTSATEYREKRGAVPYLYWLSWRILTGLLEDVPQPFAEMAGDLRQLLLEKGLTAFRGLRNQLPKSLAWQFTVSTGPRAQPRTSWNWRLPVLPRHYLGHGGAGAQNLRARSSPPKSADTPQGFTWAPIPRLGRFFSGGRDD